MKNKDKLADGTHFFAITCKCSFFLWLIVVKKTDRSKPIKIETYSNDKKWFFDEITNHNLLLANDELKYYSRTMFEFDWS